MKYRSLYIVVLLALFVSVLAFGQGHQATPSQNSPQQQKAQPSQPENAQGQFGSELAKTSNEAAGQHQGAEEKGEGAEFKESASVKWVAKITGLSTHSAYLVSILLNFAILAGLIVMISKSKLPAMFRTRTDTIQRGIKEAKKASEDANRRLADIESRLARLDTEVADMRASADADSKTEEERIRQTTEFEKKKIVEGAEAEIGAAAKLARRELKAYAAELAVSLAEKRIHIDTETDRALVDNFVSQLNSPVKDGR